MSKDGGPAFPRTTGQFDEPADGTQPGMSLRDYFAAHALSRALSDGIYTDDEGMKGVARQAYKMADAMLKQREQDSE